MAKSNCLKCGDTINRGELCWICKSEDTREKFLDISDSEIENHIQNVMKQMNKAKGDWSDDDNILQMLMSYRGVYDERIPDTALSNKIYYPSYIYYKAKASVRDGLIEELNKTDDSNVAGNLMLCLAMQGDNAALDVLWELEQNPRTWRQKLYVGPAVYAEQGGWTFDDEKNRKQLNYDICLQLTKGEAQQNEPIVVGNVREDNCAACDCRMVDILTIDGRNKHLSFLGIDGKIKATVCPNCSVYNTYYNKYTMDGESEIFYGKENFFETENYVDESDLDLLQNNKYILNTTIQPPLFPVASDDIQAIGGFGRWIQDFEYQSCPCCNNKMKLLGQLEWSLLMNGDSTCYIEICTDCNTLAVFHQNS